MSDEREAEAWNAAIEAMESAEVVIPVRLVPSRRRRGVGSMVGAVLSAVVALLFGVLLGRAHR